MYPKKELAQVVISACNQFGIDKVVVSPGSRNAPLTIGFSNHPAIDTFSIVDERCAAFFALGIAQQTKKPVAIVCTSGSALLNYYPAIAESFYSKIPLVVISADRPKHLIDIGDGQTIRQENVFHNHILDEANLIDAIENRQSNIVATVHALRTAIHEKGPVHINVPFDEPLYETDPQMNSMLLTAVKNSREVQLEVSKKKVIDWVKFSQVWNTSKRKIILIGVNYPSDELQDILHEFAKDKDVIIMTESTSNVYHPEFFNAIDQLITPLSEAEFLNLQPEVLLSLGGMVISKRIKQFFRKYQPKHHWHIDALTKMDTYFCLSEYVPLEPAYFLQKLFSLKQNNDSAYKSYWLKIKADRQEKHRENLKATVFSDLKVFEILLSYLPKDAILQLGNSAVVRYTQLFTIPSSFSVFCNRGTSGIDGSTTTAIGAAVVAEKPVVFITGDISFYYDSNALWNNYVPASFRIIIVNNSGGNIFKIIPGPKSTNALEYFETPHNLTAEFLAKTYGFAYESVNTGKQLLRCLGDFYKDSGNPKILEIFTPSDANDVVLKNYFKNL